MELKIYKNHPSFMMQTLKILLIFSSEKNFNSTTALVSNNKIGHTTLKREKIFIGSNFVHTIEACGLLNVCYAVKWINHNSLQVNRM